MPIFGFNANDYEENTCTRNLAIHVIIMVNKIIIAAVTSTIPGKSKIPQHLSFYGKYLHISFKQAVQHPAVKIEKAPAKVIKNKDPQKRNEAMNKTAKEQRLKYIYIKIFKKYKKKKDGKFNKRKLPGLTQNSREYVTMHDNT